MQGEAFNLAVYLCKFKITQRNYQSPPLANGLIDRQQTLIKGAYLFDNLELTFVFINFNLIGV